MEPAKRGNIEPGCLAMVVGRCPEDNGKIVTVGGFLGRVPDPSKNGTGFYWGQRWEIDNEVLIVDMRTGKPTYKGKINHLEESHLLRIDPEEGQFDESESYDSISRDVLTTA